MMSFTEGVIVDDQYKPPFIAKLLHALPHYNITFHRTNSTFRPTNLIYLESLGIFCSIPVGLLIVSLFGLLLYLMTRCCDRKPRPQHSITSLKVVLSVVTVLCCAAIGLGLYGNDDLHNGLLEVLTAGRKVDNLVSAVRNQTNTLEFTLTQKIRPQLVELADIFDHPASNQTALSMLFISLNTVQGNVTLATNAASDIRRPLMGISMNGFLNRGDQYELIRWPGTVAILALLLVLCAVLLVGVARHSRCALILFSVCGLLAVTGSWLMSGIYLSTSVAVGDLCIDPADYLVSQAPTELPADILLYYTQCESARSNPFTQRLRESQQSINNARVAMNTVSQISLKIFKNAGLQPKLGAVTADLNTSERLLTQLTALVDCKAVHFNYLNATRGLCEGGLLGLVLMLIASFIAAILLTIMVWVDSHTWIYIRKRNDYAQVDEQSYISHQGQQNHQNMTRTLPRPENNGPPVMISGSHTLQHPNRQQKQIMMQPHVHPHHHNTMGRPIGMGTHTLGRLPSHNHSPQHMHGGGGGVGGVGSQATLPKNMKNGNRHFVGPNNGNDQNHPPRAPEPVPPVNHQMINQQQQQQQQMMNSQPIYQQKVPMQNYQQQQQNYSIYQSQMSHQQQQQNHQQQQQLQQAPIAAIQQQTQQQIYPPPPHYHQHRHSETTGILVNKGQTQTMTRQSNTVTFAKDTLDASTPDSGSLYERDKQNVYKCSTLRHGGKFDSAKPSSIQNYPLPAIPNSTGQITFPTQSQVQSVQIKKESKDGIYSSSRILPQNRKIPTGKAVPLPKIGSFDKPPSTNLSTFASAPAPVTTVSNSTSNHNSNGNTVESTYSTNKRDHSLPPPPTASELKQQMAQMQAQSQQQGSNGNTEGSEFYAVTEL